MVANNNAALLLHQGARHVSMNELHDLSAPPSTKTWYPIAHHRVLDSVLSCLDGSGFEVQRMALGVSADNHKFFGVLDLASTIIEGVTMAIGVRNSTDKSLPAGIAAGERVLVCDNLAFSATIVIMRKHTRRIEQELPERIQEGIGQLDVFQQASARQIERLRERDIADHDAHDLIVRAVDNNCIGLREIPKVLQEWREPSHEAFQPRTAWSLHNAFTEVAKPRFDSNPTSAATRTIRLNKLFAGMLN